MRMPITCFVLVLIALFSVTPCSADILTLTQAGSNWTISVTRPPGVDAIGGFDLDVKYNPLKLAVASVDFGALLGDLSSAEALANSLDSGSLLNLMEVSLLSPATLAGMQPTTFDLATIHFTDLGTGFAPGVSITRADVSDAFGNPVIPAAVPEPASWALLGSAAVLMAGVLRRRVS